MTFALAYMANKLNGVSILTVGEARGHNLTIDQTSLEQALKVAQSMKRIKVTMGHGAPVTGILGYIDNFLIKGDRLMGDLNLFNTNEAQFVEQLAQVLPEGFGISLTFSGVPEIMGAERFEDWTVHREGLDWFAENFPNEYMVLLD